MTRKQLFESFNDAAYDNTTDPFGAILEGPKFTFGKSDADVANGDSEEAGEIGRSLKGEPQKTSHTMTADELEAARAASNELSGDELADEDEPSDLEKQADEILHADSMYDPMSALHGHVKSATDAMNYVDDIGEFDIAKFDDPEFGISGEEIVKTGAGLPDELDTDEQFGLDDPEAVIGEDEPVVEDPITTPDSDIIALSNISDDELIKELQHRMLLKKS